ncbi:MAG: hypothetical protein ABSH19_05395, partial [Opitutales bacterium]
MKSLVFSLLAIVVGYFLLTLGVGFFALYWFRDPATEPSLRYFELSIAVAFVCAVVSGFVVALLAPRRPLTHAFVLIALVTAMTIVAVIRERNREPNGWYEPAGLAATVSGILAG